MESAAVIDGEVAPSLSVLIAHLDVEVNDIAACSMCNTGVWLALRRGELSLDQAASIARTTAGRSGIPILASTKRLVPMMPLLTRHLVNATALPLILRKTSGTRSRSMTTACVDCQLVWIPRTVTSSRKPSTQPETACSTTEFADVGFVDALRLVAEQSLDSEPDQRRRARFATAVNIDVTGGGMIDTTG